MLLLFQRTGQRRYAILAKRPSLPDLEMNPAPGYDALMPHDLMHLVVEAQLGLTRGVFGQLAAGGDAFTFHLKPDSRENSREITRQRKQLKKRGKKLGHEGQEECAQSERATYICWYEWLARSQSDERRAVAQTMAEQAEQVRGVASTKELRKLNDEKLKEICQHLDALSSHWSRLKVGESMTVRWPNLVVSIDSAVLRSE